MALRWCAAGMLEADHQFRRVNGQMANRIINSEVQPVACLDAPEPKDARTPPALRRDLDGRSVSVRPGVSRYATEVQLSREEQLLERARQDGAPRLTRTRVARLLRADPAASGRRRPSG